MYKTCCDLKPNLGLRDFYLRANIEDTTRI